MQGDKRRDNSARRSLLTECSLLICGARKEGHCKKLASALYLFMPEKIEKHCREIYSLSSSFKRTLLYLQCVRNVRPLHSHGERVN